MPADLALDPRFLPRGTKLGEYTIESHLGEGGQGVLYRVSRGANVFTLKISTAERAQLPEAERKEIDGRIRREAATLMVIDHPNVVKLVSLRVVARRRDRLPVLRDGARRGRPGVALAGEDPPVAARDLRRLPAGGRRAPRCCTSTKSSTAT